MQAWAQVAHLRDCSTFRDLLSELEAGGGRAVAALLLRAAKLPSGDMAADMCVDACWEKLHTGSWSEVSVMWRNAYTAASLLCAYGMAGLAPAQPAQPMAQQADGTPKEAHGRATSDRRVAAPDSSVAVSAAAAATRALRQLDMATLLGGPLFRPQLDACIGSLQTTVAADCRAPLSPGVAVGDLSVAGNGHQPSSKRARLNESQKRDREPDAQQCEGQLPSSAASAAQVPLPPGATQSLLVQRQALPSLERFFEEFMCAPDGGQPLIITGGMDSWPARQRWQNLDYLRAAAGARTVPVEVGQHCLAEQWGQRLMTLSNFIDQHLIAAAPDNSTDSGQARGYLAQHELFEQIPLLQADIREPEYCSLGSGAPPRVNAWLGPPGTVTPLHTDPYHNLLSQVVGRKYVRLYQPQATSQLYPFVSGFTTNCSQVDIDVPDLERFPRFADLEHWDCILEPGDMLFIPTKWWHYVKSLTVSFSVSFWWQ